MCKKWTHLCYFFRYIGRATNEILGISEISKKTVRNIFEGYILPQSNISIGAF